MTEQVAADNFFYTNFKRAAEHGRLGAAASHLQSYLETPAYGEQSAGAHALEVAESIQALTLLMAVDRDREREQAQRITIQSEQLEARKFADARARFNEIGAQRAIEAFLTHTHPTKLVDQAVRRKLWGAAWHTECADAINAKVEQAMPKAAL